MKITLLNESDLRRCVGFTREAMDAIAEGFTRLAQGRAYAPPVISIEVAEHHGDVDIKTAYIHGLDSFAVKVASGYFDNPAKGLPFGSGVMILINAETGFLQAILADNGYLTELRTGLAGAIAAEYLARRDAVTAGIIGAGAQARYQLRGLKLVRNIKNVLVWALSTSDVTRYADEMATELKVRVSICPDAETVVRGADIVVTATPARQPFLRAAWLRPGVHVTCMGSDMPGKQELYADCFARADRVVCDRIAQAFTRGELQHAKAEHIISENKVDELGELTAAAKRGRRRDSEITICDLTGVGVQDTAIARLAYARATSLGLGSEFCSD
ncbi:MAG: cyclodeaminase [Thermoleophilia bacterium]